MLVIRFRDPRRVDLPYLLTMLKESFVSRANTIVCFVPEVAFDPGTISPRQV